MGRELAGPRASREAVERHRRYVVRWLALDGHHGMTRENAAKVAKILRTDPDRYLSERVSPAQLEARAARLQAELHELRAEIARRRERGSS